MENHIPDQFSELVLPRKSLASKGSAMKYRVYKAPRDFLVVEADTALEAMRKSGISNPFRIIRDSTFYEKLLSEDMLQIAGGEEGIALAEEARIKQQLGSDVSGLIETPEEDNALPDL